MICSICKKGETSVVDSRPTEDGTAIRRRRLCVCGARFTTFERVQFREIMVVKKNGRKSSFDRDKLSKSIYIALKKRPIDTETVEKFINTNKPLVIAVNELPPVIWLSTCSTTTGTLPTDETTIACSPFGRSARSSVFINSTEPAGMSTVADGATAAAFSSMIVPLVIPSPKNETFTCAKEADGLNTTRRSDT